MGLAKSGFPKRERSGAMRFNAGPDGVIVMMAVSRLNQLSRSTSSKVIRVPRAGT